MPKNESIRDVLMEYASANSFQMSLEEAVVKIKRIVTEKIKGMKWTYAHDSACSCASCANAVYRNVMLDRVVEMVEGLE